MMVTFKRRSLLALLLVLPAFCLAQQDQSDPTLVRPQEPALASATTGMDGLIDDLILPGSELEPKPLPDTNTPIVLRIEQVFPHVDDWRYNFSFYGIVPGRHDLRDYLQRKDGSSLEGVPPIPVEIVPIRPPGDLVRPSLDIEDPPKVGGYKWALIAIGIFWVAVMALLVFGFRKKSTEQIAQSRPATLADQLRPLVAQAQAGELTEAGQAKLELTLLGIWRKRLNLNDSDPAEAIIKLRQHEEAGGLLRELEKWLHRPGAADQVDLAELLKPYEKLPAEENLPN